MDEYTTEVASVDSLSPSTVSIDIVSPDAFEALPGQFIKVIVLDGDDEAANFYTISSPFTEDQFQITVEIDPEGTVSPLLAESDPGDSIRFQGPFGRTYYEDELDVTVFAAGPGIGPAIAIAERTQTHDNAAVTVIYQTETVIHEDRLDTVIDNGGSVTIVPPGEALSDAVDADQLQESQIFVYGFQDFVDEVVAALDAHSIPRTEAKIESFG